LSGTPERVARKVCSLTFRAREWGAAAERGVRSNELLGGAQRRLFLNELGTTRDSLNGAHPNSISKILLNAPLNY